MTNNDPVVIAFQAWDNHLRDCKATILDKPKDNPDGAPVRTSHPCAYDGDKCPRGLALYTAWKKSIGAAPEPKVRVPEFVDGISGRTAGGN